MKILSSLFLVVLFAVAACAQSEKCTTRLADAPALSGYKLGMTAKEIQKAGAWKPVSLPADEPLRVSRVVLMGKALKAASDVKEISLALLDGKVYGLSVKYNWPPGSDARDFLDVVSTPLHLPRSAWEEQPQLGYKNAYRMTCDGFEVYLTWVFGEGSISMSDPAMRAEVNRRSDEYEEKRKKAFKP
jgi:hypothetical protein